MPKKISIYTTPTCGYCIRAKAFMKENNIAYNEYDVSGDSVKAQEMIDKSGQMGVPVFDIDGTLVIGFDKARIQELLAK